jgi:hypothetical protein
LWLRNSHQNLKKYDPGQYRKHSIKGIFLLSLLSVCMVLFLWNALPAIAGTPHIIYGNVFNPDGTPPVKDNVDSHAYVLERPGEILSKSSVGCGYDIFLNGWLWFEAGNYIVPWEANEHLRIIVVDSILENTGVTDLILDSSGKQQISALCLQSGDHVGPIASNALVDGLSYATIFEGTGSVTLTATLDDSICGNINIQSAEYFIDSDPGYGSGTAMDPGDGSFNSLEGVSTSVNTSTWIRGSTHIIYVRGRDSSGNWGTTHHASVVTVVPACPQNGKVVCLDANGTEHVFQSLQSAIDASGAGWKITVGPGIYNELVNISGKTDLIIKGCDRPTVNGRFNLSQARNIVIDGFDIIAGSGNNAISMLGVINSSENVTISNNFIHGADIEHSGISAARDNLNYIY